MKSTLASLLLLSGATVRAGDWDYDTMDGWVHHYPFCGTNDQSPINIRDSEVVYDSSVCKPALNWTVDWSVHDFKIKNNGHSVEVIAVERADDTIPELTDVFGRGFVTREEPLAKLPNYFLPEGSPHTEFCLHGFHMHWGDIDATGSEHLLNDKQYPLEIHFVHYSCHRNNLGEAHNPYSSLHNISDAIAAGKDYHELAVVGIFVEVSDFDNPAFDAILSEDTLIKVQYPGDWHLIDRVYLQHLVPEDISTSGYYAYEGSLTTPPCTNIVRWHVSNSKISIGKGQLRRFRELMFTANKTQAPNFRDPQFNVNPVYGCMEDPSSTDDDRSTTEIAIVWLWLFLIIFCMCGLTGVCYFRSQREHSTEDQKQETGAKRERILSHSSVQQSQLRQSMSAHHQTADTAGYPHS